MKLHKCWKHGIWRGYEQNILICRKCNEMIGFKYPEIYNEDKYGFVPMNKEAMLHETEIRTLYHITPLSVNHV